MTVDYSIYWSLIYRAGNIDAINDAYERAIAEHEDFEWDSVLMKPAFGTVTGGCGEPVREITGMVPKNRAFECESCRVDLNDAPVGAFRLSDHCFKGAKDLPEGMDQGDATLELAEMVKTLYLATGVSPLAAYTEPKWVIETISTMEAPPFTAESLAKDRYEYLSWLTVFSPPMVETYGRETLLDAPAYHVEELADGSVLLVAVENPMDRHGPEKSQYKEIGNHIGIDTYA
jgi:hypothetical protein